MSPNASVVYDEFAMNETLAAERARAVATGIAHDVRNAMVAMSATVEMLESIVGADGTPAGTLVLALRKQVDTMSELMSDLDDFAAPQLNPLEPEPVGNLLAQARVNVEPIAVARQVTIREKTDSAATSVVSADRRSLVVAFQHLLACAIQRSPRGGTVLLNAHVLNGDRAVEVAITDNGVALAADDQQRRLEPFFPRLRGGYGLRLAIAQRIISQHGGMITPGGSSAAETRMLVRVPLAT